MIRSLCVIGLGYIGLPTAAAFARAGLDVLGVDIKQDVVDGLSRGQTPFEEAGLSGALSEALASGRLKFSTKPSSADAYIITVQTPQRMGENGAPVSDLSYVRAAARDVGSVLKPGQLIILESTVPPRTTRAVRDEAAAAAGLMPESVLTAHCPERVIPGRILTELAENDRIVGADDDDARRAARELYSRVLNGGKVYETDTVTAELCKLAENTFRDINIAYANELSVICHNLGVDVYQLIELANKHPRVNIHTPGAGVGGHCIAVDPWFIHEACPQEARMIGAARAVNDGKPRFIAERVAEAVEPGGRVCVFGLAYKPDVDDLRESPALVLCGLLSEKGYAVRVCEPHVKASEINGYINLSVDQALRCGDRPIVAMGHSAFRAVKEKLKALGAYDCVGLIT